MTEQMKESGIDWIGDIPKSWDVVRIKDIGRYRNGLTYAPEDIAEDDNGTLVLRSSNIQNGKISYDDNVYVKCFVSPELMVKKGDIIICSRNGSRELIGKNAIIENSGVACSFGAFMMVYRCSCPRYMYYILNSEVFSYYLGTFLTSTINQLTGNNFGNMKIVFCKDRNKQRKIVDFLDKECAQIDSIAADLEKQIELLQQYKKSLITETVTKGLNKSVPMKDSGIDWIGKIPNHYEIIPLKYLFSLYAGGDVDEFDFSDEQNEKQKYPIYSNSLENKGLFGYTSKYRFSGKTFTVTGRGDIGKAIPRFESYYPIVRLLACIPKSNANNEYYSFCVNCADVLGDQTAMSQLTTQKLGAIKVPMPPLKEQKQIVEFLNQKCLIVDQTISIKENQLNKLEQHKKSLIYEYVTGKKRVKEVQ